MEPYQNKTMILTAHGIISECLLDKKKVTFALNFCKNFVEFKDDSGKKIKSLRIH